jgi:hypothetical protein
VSLNLLELSGPVQACNGIALPLPKVNKHTQNVWKINIHWKPLIMITLELALFDKSNRMIILSGGYKNLHYLTQFIVTAQPFTCIKSNKINLKKLV